MSDVEELRDRIAKLEELVEENMLDYRHDMQQLWEQLQEFRSEMGFHYPRFMTPRGK